MHSIKSSSLMVHKFNKQVFGLNHTYLNLNSFVFPIFLTQFSFYHQGNYGNYTITLEIIIINCLLFAIMKEIMMGEGIRLISGTIDSIRVGKPTPLQYKNKIVQSAIYKDEVHQPIHVSKNNLEGDEQSDLKHHGGPDKAICVYPTEHYKYWSEKTGQLFQAGDFGENLTLSGLTEDKVAIGDILKVEECLFQVTQPREPCYKIAARHKIEQLPNWIRITGYSGYYLRVLKEGVLTKGSTIEIIERDPQRITIAYANQIMHHDSGNVEAIHKILSMDALSESWKKQFSKKLTLLK